MVANKWVGWNTIEIITWNNIIINVRWEYLKPYNLVQIIRFKNTWYHITVQFFF